MKQTKKAIYAFSGDPITYGHCNIIERASRAFDELVVGIGENPDKNYMFSLEERTNMAKKSLSKFDNVNVVSFDELLVDYCYENNINVIVKGVRNAADFDYENVLHQVGESQKLGVDTHILFAKPEIAHISSSVVKAIQSKQGLIQDYVPLNVKQKLEEKMSGQYILGVTGEMGSGKSYVSAKMVEYGKASGIDVHNIEMDYIGHDILNSLSQPRYQNVREEIANEFGNEIVNDDGSLNRKNLGEIVFNDKKGMAKLNDIMYTPMIVRLRKEMYQKKGMILINGALIAEANYSELCNNNVVVVEVNNDVQKERLYERGLDDSQIAVRLSTQYNSEHKKKILSESVKKYDSGKIFSVDNSDEGDIEIKKMFENVIDYFGVDKK